MNWVRNLVKGTRPDDGEPSSTHGDLSFSPQLKKLLEDLSRPTIRADEDARNVLLGKIAPHFCRKFAGAHFQHLPQLAEAPMLALEFGRVLVKQLKTRVSKSGSGIEAAVSVASYLEWRDGVGEGWLLLNAVTLLALSGQPAVLQNLCSSRLPTALSQALCVLFHLPEVCAEHFTYGKGLRRVEFFVPALSEQSRSGKEGPLGKVDVSALLGSVLRKLFQTTEAVTCVVQSDSLGLLLDFACKKWPAHCAVWQQVASEVLHIFSRNLNQSAVEYITLRHGLVPICLQSLQNFVDGEKPHDPHQLVDAATAVFSILQSSDQRLSDEFESCHAYRLLTEVFLAVEAAEDGGNPLGSISFSQKGGEEVSELLADFTVMLCKCGPAEIRPPAMDNVPFQDSNFAVPLPTGNGKCSCVHATRHACAYIAVLHTKAVTLSPHVNQLH